MEKREYIENLVQQAGQHHYIYLDYSTVDPHLIVLTYKNNQIQKNSQSLKNSSLQIFSENPQFLGKILQNKNNFEIQVQENYNFETKEEIETYKFEQNVSENSFYGKNKQELYEKSSQLNRKPSQKSQKSGNIIIKLFLNIEAIGINEQIIITTEIPEIEIKEIERLELEALFLKKRIQFLQSLKQMKMEMEIESSHQIQIKENVEGFSEQKLKIEQNFNHSSLPSEKINGLNKNSTKFNTKERKSKRYNMSEKNSKERQLKIGEKPQNQEEHKECVHEEYVKSKIETTMNENKEFNQNQQENIKKEDNLMENKINEYTPIKEISTKDEEIKTVPKRSKKIKKEEKIQKSPKSPKIPKAPKSPKSPKSPKEKSEKASKKVKKERKQKKTEKVQNEEEKNENNSSSSENSKNSDLENEKNSKNESAELIKKGAFSKEIQNETKDTEKNEQFCEKEQELCEKEQYFCEKNDKKELKNNEKNTKKIKRETNRRKNNKTNKVNSPTRNKFQENFEDNYNEKEKCNENEMLNENEKQKNDLKLISNEKKKEENNEFEKNSCEANIEEEKSESKLNQNNHEQNKKAENNEMYHTENVNNNLNKKNERTFYENRNNESEFIERNENKNEEILGEIEKEFKGSEHGLNNEEKMIDEEEERNLYEPQTPPNCSQRSTTQSSLTYPLSPSEPLSFSWSLPSSMTPSQSLPEAIENCLVHCNKIEIENKNYEDKCQENESLKSNCYENNNENENDNENDNHNSHVNSNSSHSNNSKNNSNKSHGNSEKEKKVKEKDPKEKQTDIKQVQEVKEKKERQMDVQEIDKKSKKHPTETQIVELKEFKEKLEALSSSNVEVFKLEEKLLYEYLMTPNPIMNSIRLSLEQNHFPKAEGFIFWSIKEIKEEISRRKKHQSYEHPNSENSSKHREITQIVETIVEVQGEEIQYISIPSSKSDLNKLWDCPYILIFKNNQIYMGDIKVCERGGYPCYEGFGHYVNISKRESYKGGFKSGDFEGVGVCTDESGTVYIGQFKNNLKNGIGLEVYNYGSFDGWEEIFGLKLKQKENLSEPSEKNIKNQENGDLKLKEIEGYIGEWVENAKQGYGIYVCGHVSEISLNERPNFEIPKDTMSMGEIQLYNLGEMLQVFEREDIINKEIYKGMWSENYCWGWGELERDHGLEKGYWFKDSLIQRGEGEEGNKVGVKLEEIEEPEEIREEAFVRNLSESEMVSEPQVEYSDNIRELLYNNSSNNQRSSSDHSQVCMEEANSNEENKNFAERNNNIQFNNQENITMQNEISQVSSEIYRYEIMYDDDEDSENN